MSAEQIPTLTEADYLAGEQHSEVRHEFVGGRVWAMAGGTERHDIAGSLLNDLLRPAVRASGCRIFTGNRQLRVASGDIYYPDLFTVCGRAADVHHEADANLVVEILSPSTATIDRREKLTAYATLPSFDRYLLVDPIYPSMELYRKGRWERIGPGGQVSLGHGVTIIDIDEFYAALDAEATT